MEADLPLLTSEPITPESNEPATSELPDAAVDVAPVVPSVEEPTVCAPVPHAVKTEAETQRAKVMIELFVFMSFCFADNLS